MKVAENVGWWFAFSCGWHEAFCYRPFSCRFVICNFILVLLSLHWLCYTMSSLGSLSLLMKFAMWKATKYEFLKLICSQTTNTYRFGEWCTERFNCIQGTTNAIPLAKTSDGYSVFHKGNHKRCTGKCRQLQLVEVWCLILVPGRNTTSRIDSDLSFVLFACIRHFKSLNVFLNMSTCILNWP